MAHANDLGIGMAPFVSGGVIVANSMVKLDTTEGRVIACTAMADLPIGVSVDGATAAGEQVRVQIMGIAKARLQDTVSTIGAELCVFDGGTGGLDAAGSLGASVVVCAKALQAGVSGDIITVILLGPVGLSPANT